jgi:hypothetical protein
LNGIEKHPDQDNIPFTGRLSWVLVSCGTSLPRAFEIEPGIRRLKMVSKTMSTKGSGINTERPAQVASA